MNEHQVLHTKLESARRELLDLSIRNRLLNTSRGAARSGRLDIVDELTEQVHRILMQEKMAMTFKAGCEEAQDDEQADLTHLTFAQPDDREVDANGVAARHTDHQLQTRLTSESLQRRLLTLFRDARTSEEEQGVNVLYLALGFLKWFEDDKSDTARHAPLILVPVMLDRRSATARFQLKATDDELNTNLSLQERLRADFGLLLPDLPDGDDLSPTAYFQEVSQVVASKRRWEVLPNDIVLWFFSFSKFLMYRDLLPETWPRERPIDGHPLINALLRDGFRNEPPLCGDDEKIDQLLPVSEQVHVMDADSSQAVVIEEVKRGRNLVVQGPPGTGKSQTIANMIAAAVQQGRTVLFVAEKMAALDVVKRRLNGAGLGDMCLELHSHKANKVAVLDELQRTMQRGQPSANDAQRQSVETQAHRDRLNRHVELMHRVLEPAHVTPYQAIGELVRLRSTGVPPADVRLEAPLTWTRDDVREKSRVLHDLAIHAGEVGNPQQNPWRGVQLEAVLPNDIQRLVATLPTLRERVENLSATTQELAECLCWDVVGTPRDSEIVARVAACIVKAPPGDRASLTDDVWSRQRGGIDKLVQTGQMLANAQEYLTGLLSAVAWTTDVTPARRGVAAYGRSWFRHFYREYRRATATLRGILQDLPPQHCEDQLRLLDDLIRWQQAKERIAADDAGQRIGSRAFGQLWQGHNSDWQSLAAIVAWESECRMVGVPDRIRTVAASVTDVSRIRVLATRIIRELQPVMDELSLVFSQLEMDLESAFGKADPWNVAYASLISRLARWYSQAEDLSKWTAYYSRWKQLASDGMGMLARQLDQGQVSPDSLVDRFRSAYFEAIIREMFRRNHELAQFDGVSHERVLKKFQQLDKERLGMASREVAWAHHARLSTADGHSSEIGVIYRELKKKRRHLPLRKLLTQAGRAIQSIKPVFMMSPISVAQYLDAGALEFDLLLIDEASQVRPVEALGAIARARQVSVVGDDRQLPPTMFFNRMADEGVDDTEADSCQAADLESILGLCEAQKMPRRMLKWHYRSRHHSLIAVSNREFYDSRLFIVPSPTDTNEALGLRFHHVADGTFDRGGSRVNRIEARRVADAVMHHARHYPDQTLGVGTFSLVQRDAIFDELELRRRESPSLESFFAATATEPFFVKNLENIQGDERDVIFISVGYGKDTSGYMAMSFGPLNSDGGERRLNVLITRARQRCEVFSSIVAGDIDLHRTKARGVKALKTFLTYAATGNLDTNDMVGRDYDSEFERQVANAITAHGYQVDAQVGAAGFRIDLAVVDADCPGRYLVGIECDGATYHSSRSARDRDRLRQAVLEDRGWIIHRIWSTDWFRRPDEQLKKVLTAIELAKVHLVRRAECPQMDGESWEPMIAESLERRKERPDKSVVTKSSAMSSYEESPPAETVETKAIATASYEEAPLAEVVASSVIAITSYEEADFCVDVSGAIDQTPVSDVMRIVRRVVEIEEPIHEGEVARRVESLWGLTRADSQSHDAVKNALATAIRERLVVKAGSFIQVADRSRVRVRNRQRVKSANLREPAFIPPSEISVALVAVVRDHRGVSLEEALSQAGRLLGFQTTNAHLRELMYEEIRLLKQSGIVQHQHGKLYVVQSECCVPV